MIKSRIVSFVLLIPVIVLILSGCYYPIEDSRAQDVLNEPLRDVPFNEGIETPEPLPTLAAPSDNPLPEGCYELNDHALEVLSRGLSNQNGNKVVEAFAVDLPSSEVLGTDFVTKEEEVADYKKWGFNYAVVAETVQMIGSTHSGFLLVDNFENPSIVAQQALYSDNWNFGDQEKPEDQFGIAVDGTLWELQNNMTRSKTYLEALSCARGF